MSSRRARAGRGSRARARRESPARARRESPAGERREGGFTLLELLLVVVVSAAVIALLALMYRQVQRTGQALAAVESDWQLQVFLRRQLLARDERFDPLELTGGDASSLRLVTRYSATHAMAGPPVLAHYQFLPNEEQLVYRETPLPPWWLEGQTPAEFRTLAFAEETLGQAPRVLLEGVSALSFDYGDGSDTAWRSAWADGAEAEPPALVRLRFSRLGLAVDWTMPTRLLRYALPAVPLAAE